MFHSILFESAIADIVKKKNRSLFSDASSGCSGYYTIIFTTHNMVYNETNQFNKLNDLNKQI